MELGYTDERNIQILIALMKGHGIKKVIASPGTVNIPFIVSIQSDPYFEIYSSVDERSAAYMACGLAAESGEAVALSCTGATASRNYIPGLTEAFYRKLPILAITSTVHQGRIGHNIPQVIDRSQLPKDIAVYSAQVPIIHSKEDEWACEMEINTALLELVHHGGGPVHINLETIGSQNYGMKELPACRTIKRIVDTERIPKLPKGKIGIFVGAHKKWSKELTEYVDSFCEAYNGVVFCDQTSNYDGKYRIYPSLVCFQEKHRSRCQSLDLLIHIGDVSGCEFKVFPREVWRVNPDGVVRDTFRKLKHVFEMEEITFFKRCIEISDEKSNCSYYQMWRDKYEQAVSLIEEVPYSNVWTAQKTIPLLPEDSVLYLGILNSLRSWNLFERPEGIIGYANTGGFGIDGGMSSLVGASLANPQRLCFGITGDLALFYDMNVLGNRHVGNNVRIMVINNGKGAEFRKYYHPGNRFGEDADLYIAAAGHFGNKSTDLLKHYAEDLGFEYMVASNKEEYSATVECFVNPVLTDKPILFEVFTDSEDESEALRLIRNLSFHPCEKENVAELLGNGMVGKVGIFAVTDVGKRILTVGEELKADLGVEIFLFDSDERKHGSRVGNYEILNPKEIASYMLDRLIIANELYYEEIYDEYKFLEKDGVEILGIENV